jgi:hypothetical protein
LSPPAVRAPALIPSAQEIDFGAAQRRIFLTAIERRHFEVFDFSGNVFQQRAVVRRAGGNRGLAARAALQQRFAHGDHQTRARFFAAMATRAGAFQDRADVAGKVDRSQCGLVAFTSTPLAMSARATVGSPVSL